VTSIPGGTLSAATQIQAGSIPAVKKGSLFYVWLCAFELRQEEHRVLPSREVLPSGMSLIT